MSTEPRRGNRMAATSAALCAFLIPCAFVHCQADDSPHVELLHLEAASPAPDIVLVLHVRDAEGQDVPNASVWLWPDGPVTSGHVWPPQVPLAGGGKADSSGRFTLHAHADNQLYVAKAPFVGDSSGLWTVAEGCALRDALGEVPVTLRKQARFVGMVTDERSKGVNEAVVRFESCGATAGGGGRPRCPGPVRTNSNGFFEVDLDPGGCVQVTARKYGTDSQTETIHPDVGSNDFTQDLVIAGEAPFLIEAAWDLSGVPTSDIATPDPRPFVTVWADLDDGRDSVPRDLWERLGLMKLAPDRERMAFRFAAPHLGRYTIAGCLNGIGTAPPVTVELSRQCPHASVTLRPVGVASISGTVVRADGSGVPWISVSVTAPGEQRLSGPGGPLPYPSQYGVGFTRTDQQGHFEIGGLMPGHFYRMQCELEQEEVIDTKGNPVFGRTLVEQNVPTGTHDLRLVAVEGVIPGVELVGRVFDSQTGEALDDCFLTVVHVATDAPYRERGVVIERDGGGRFRVPNLIEGDLYALRCYVRDTPGGQPHAEARTDLFVLDNSLGEVRIEVPAPAVLEVDVRDETGAPLPAARVMAQGVSITMMDIETETSSRYWDGRAVFPNMPPGRYALICTAGPYEGESEIELLDGGHVTTTLVLHRAD